MPHSEEAETSVIGGILVHARFFPEVAAELVADDFYHPALRAIFEAMVNLDADSKPIDSLTVETQMRGMETFDKLRAFKGREYLLDLMGRVVTAENIGYHAGIVRRKANVRRLVETCRAIADEGMAEYGDDDDFIARSEAKLAAAGGRRDSARVATYEEVLHQTIKNMELRFERKQVVTGVPSGFRDLDLMTGGDQPGDLVIVGARPSMGKTALAMNEVLRAATMGVPCRHCAKIISFTARRCPHCEADAPAGDHDDPRFPHIVFSLEMSKEALVERNLCSTAYVDSMDVRAGRLSSKDWIRITTVAGQTADAPIQIDDTSSPTLQEIRAKVRRWRSNARYFPPNRPERFGRVVIDYLGLIGGVSSDEHNNHRATEIGKITAGLKALAKDTRCAVVVLCQLNRGLESRTDKRPVLSDLRESGAIEQDADVIKFIYRDEVYSKDECKPEDRGIAEVIIGKQRNGPTGTVRLRFKKKFTRFDDLPREGQVIDTNEQAPPADLLNRPPPRDWHDDSNEND